MIKGVLFAGWLLSRSFTFLCNFLLSLCVCVSKVLAATSLRPTDLQGYSDPYCVCYLKIPDATAGGSGATDDRFQGQRGETYFCEKTLNPKWSGQRFIFKVWCRVVWCGNCGVVVFTGLGLEC